MLFLDCDLVPRRMMRKQSASKVEGALQEVQWTDSCALQSCNFANLHPATCNLQISIPSTWQVQTPHSGTHKLKLSTPNLPSIYDSQRASLHHHNYPRHHLLEFEAPTAIQIPTFPSFETASIYLHFRASTQTFLFSSMCCSCSWI